MHETKFPLDVVVENEIDLEFYLPYRIHHLALRIGFVGEGTGDDVFNEAGVSEDSLRVREWRLLLLLASRGPLSSSEIAAQSGMEKATVTRASKQMKLQGLIVSGVSPTDKRKSYMTLTKKGAALFDRLAIKRQKQVSVIESCLSDVERKTFYQLLNKLDAHLLEEIEKKHNSDIEWKY